MRGLRRKIGARYFNEDYWITKGERSGYSPEEGYVRSSFQWEALALLLVDVFGADKSFMEAGCAFGWLVAELSKLGVKSCGFDISPYAIEHAPREIDVIQSDGLTPVYPDNSFDVIYSFETAEHIRQADVPAWWANLYKCLKPGGKVFATICLGHDNKRGADDPDLSHQTLRPWEWWYDMTEKIGFIRDKKLEDITNAAEIKTDRLDEPLNLIRYYKWNVLGLKKGE